MRNTTQRNVPLDVGVRDRRAILRTVPDELCARVKAEPLDDSISLVEVKPEPGVKFEASQTPVVKQENESRGRTKMEEDTALPKNESRLDEMDVQTNPIGVHPNLRKRSPVALAKAPVVRVPERSRSAATGKPRTKTKNKEIQQTLFNCGASSVRSGSPATTTGLRSNGSIYHTATFLAERTAQLLANLPPPPEFTVLVRTRGDGAHASSVVEEDGDEKMEESDREEDDEDVEPTTDRLARLREDLLNRDPERSALWSLAVAEARAALLLDSLNGTNCEMAYKCLPEFAADPAKARSFLLARADAAMNNNAQHEHRAKRCWEELFPGLSRSLVCGPNGRAIFDTWDRYVTSVRRLKAVRWAQASTTESPSTPVLRKIDLQPASESLQDKPPLYRVSFRSPLSAADEARYVLPHPVCLDDLFGFYHYLHHRLHESVSPAAPTPESPETVLDAKPSTYSSRVRWSSKETSDEYVKESWEKWTDLLSSARLPDDSRRVQDFLSTRVWFPRKMSRENSDFLSLAAYWRHLDDCRYRSLWDPLNVRYPDRSDPRLPLLVVWNAYEKLEPSLVLPKPLTVAVAQPTDGKCGQEFKPSVARDIPRPNPCLDVLHWDENSQAMNTFLRREDRNYPDDPEMVDATVWKKIGAEPMDARVRCTFVCTPPAEKEATGDELGWEENAVVRQHLRSCWVDLDLVWAHPSYRLVMKSRGFESPEIAHQILEEDPLHKFNLRDLEVFETTVLFHRGDLDETEVIRDTEEDDSRTESEIASCWFASLPTFPVDLDRCRTFVRTFEGPAHPSRKRTSGARRTASSLA